MDNVKVRLNIVLPGRIMFSKQECFKQLKKKTKKGIKIIEEPIPEMFINETLVLKDNKTRSTTVIHYKMPKYKPASKTINLTQEAYEYMTKGECPSWCNIKVWKRMNAVEKLEAHLNRLAEHNGGKVDNYQVLDD